MLYRLAEDPELLAPLGKEEKDRDDSYDLWLVDRHGGLSRNVSYECSRQSSDPTATGSPHSQPPALYAPTLPIFITVPRLGWVQDMPKPPAALPTMPGGPIAIQNFRKCNASSGMHKER